MTADKLYNELILNNYFTETELKLVCDVAGLNVDTLNNCIYVRYGYNDYEGLVRG